MGWPKIASRIIARAFASASGPSSSGSPPSCPSRRILLSAYYCAFDKQTPRHVQAALLGAIAYFILPFDIIPDMLPVLGFTDDAAVLATAMRLVASHITSDHREAARAALKRGIDRES